MQPPAGNRKLKSDVWQFFDYQLSSAAAGGRDDKAICKRCGHTLSACSANGTSHLRRHVGSKSCAARAAARQQDPAVGAKVEHFPDSTD